MSTYIWSQQGFFGSFDVRSSCRLSLSLYLTTSYSLATNGESTLRIRAAALSIRRSVCRSFVSWMEEASFCLSFCFPPTTTELTQVRVAKCPARRQSKKKTTTIYLSSYGWMMINLCLLYHRRYRPPSVLFLLALLLWTRNTNIDFSPFRRGTNFTTSKIAQQ